MRISTIIYLIICSLLFAFHRYLSGNKIKQISKDDLPRSLITLELRGNPLSELETGALQNMPRLKKLFVDKYSRIDSIELFLNSFFLGNFTEYYQTREIYVNSHRSKDYHR